MTLGFGFGFGLGVTRRYTSHINQRRHLWSRPIIRLLVGHSLLVFGEEDGGREEKRKRSEASMATFGDGEKGERQKIMAWPR